MSLLTKPITIELPVRAAEQLEQEAVRQKRNVRDLAREFVLERLSGFPSLPDDVEAELAAFYQLSDNVLWLIARTALTVDEQVELADLNDEAQSRDLTGDEEARREALLGAYDRVLVRRAQAAAILQSRGYDLSDPAILIP